MVRLFDEFLERPTEELGAELTIWIHTYLSSKGSRRERLAGARVRVGKLRAERKIKDWNYRQREEKHPLFLLDNSTPLGDIEGEGPDS